MESMWKAARMNDEEDKGKETLDANIWGHLQEYIPLQNIYEKLSQRDLFPLRLVNKEWSHAALQWILPKPSFVTIAGGLRPTCYDKKLVNGIVTYNCASGKFKFNPQCLRLLDLGAYSRPFEVEGLILCHKAYKAHNPYDLKELGVYNVHTRTWHDIPAGPRQSDVYGLVVDTTVKPYTFKLIEGNISFRTQIYDSKSKSWSRTSSRLPKLSAKCLWDFREYSCICHNDNVYISLGRLRILKYSLKDDKCTNLKYPEVRTSYNNPLFDEPLGVWAGRIFTTAEKKERIFSTAENEEKYTVVVWELVDSEAQEWVEYARMPVEDWLWDFVHTREYWYCMRSFFSDGYLLICSWQFDGARTLAKVRLLFDLATKVWQQVDLPHVNYDT